MAIPVVSCRGMYTVPVASLHTLITRNVISIDEAKLFNTVQGIVYLEQVEKGVTTSTYQPIVITKGRDSLGRIDYSVKAKGRIIHFCDIGKTGEDMVYVDPRFWKYLNAAALHRQLVFVQKTCKCLGITCLNEGNLVDDFTNRIFHPEMYKTEEQLYNELTFKS